MGMIKVSFYTIECNRCSCLLEDYAGELARITTARQKAEELARENGFVQTGNNTWVCPVCAKK